MPQTIADLLRLAQKRLGAGELLDSEVMLSDMLGETRAYVLAHPEDVVSKSIADRFLESVRRRGDGEPLAYIRGFKEFYGRKFMVTPDTLVPRPETEELIDIVKPRITPGISVWDIGTGSGCIAITLALETSGAISGFDISKQALTVARQNARALGAEVEFDWADIWPAYASKPQIVIANLPYLTPIQIAQQKELSYEPQNALDGGDDGLMQIRELLKEAPPDCELYLEIDPSQESFLERSSGRSSTFYPSLGGEIRFVHLARV